MADFAVAGAFLVEYTWALSGFVKARPGDVSIIEKETRKDGTQPQSNCLQYVVCQLQVLACPYPFLLVYATGLLLGTPG